MISQSTRIIGNRYALVDKIGAGSMGAVYRAIDRLNGSQVALKQVDKSPDRLFAASLSTSASFELALVNEFKILSGLRHPNIVSVLDYGFEAQQPYFTMDLLEKPRYVTDAADHQARNTQLKLLVQMLQALLYLHQHGVIHRDLKPANVLVTSDGQVKVLDFGLAISVEYVAHTSAGVSGTLAYMAPEVVQGSAPASILSDLYSAGLIAYQVLVGRYPYTLDSLTALLDDITNHIPDVDSLERPLGAVISRLLAKNPIERYTDVNTALYALNAATGNQYPVETAATRESFLQAATFIGRDSELAQLTQGIQRATEGQGGVYLIGGESGVGKSRLLNELRTRALVEHMLALRGQAVAQGGGLYQVWQLALRWLCMINPVTSLEASVIKNIVPDVETLVGFPVSDAPELSPQAERERLENVMLSLLERHNEPMLLIFEDLQWAGDESVAFIQRLAPLIANRSLLIVGSYRDDEAPGLPNKMPAAQRIKLERLPVDAVAQLSVSMLGPAGRNPLLVQLLARETEGNVFFIVETLRALAENAGGLRQVGENPLPTEIATGGMLAILRRRLERVPPSAQPLLQLAAVRGRELDLALLQRLSPGTALAQWLLACGDAAVLEADENRWRFSHDKLREQLLRDLQADAGQLRTLHQQVAQAIEALYPEDVSQIPALAYHWVQADIPEKAVYYNELAAQRAVRSAAPQAIQYMQTAMSFDGRVADLPPIRKAMRSSVIGLAYQYVGNNELALAALIEALVALNISVTPTNPFFTIMAVLRQIGIQIAHRIWPTRFLGRRESQWFSSDMLKALQAIPFLHQRSNQMLNTLHMTLVAMNTLETLRPSTTTSPVTSYGMLQIAFASLGAHPLARYYRQLIEAMLVAPVWSPLLTTYQVATSESQIAIYDYMRADWSATFSRLDKTIPHLKEIGEMHSVEVSYSILGLVYERSGRFNEAHDTFQATYAKVKKRADRELQFLLFGADAVLLWRMGKLNRAALDDFELLIDTAASGEVFAGPYKTNASNEALYDVLQVAYYIQNSDPGRAWHALQHADQIVKKAGLDRNMTASDLYDLAAHVCRLLIANSQGAVLPAGVASEIRQIWQRMLKMLSRLTSAYALARPAVHLHRGWLLLDNQKHANAKIEFSASLDGARQLHIPYDEGLAHQALAQLSVLSESERGQHRQAAERIFTELGVTVGFLAAITPP